jgi:hypothetical protein
VLDLRRCTDDDDIGPIDDRPRVATAEAIETVDEADSDRRTPNKVAELAP